MEILCLDENFQNLGYMEYINLQWTRRYYECGEFSMQIRSEDYSPDIKYLYTSERPETGMVEKIHTDQDITGHYVQVSGRFFESMLGRNIIYPRYAKDGKPAAASRAIVKKYATDVPNLTVASASGTDTDDVVDVDYTGQYVDETTYALLQAAEKSQRITYDFETNQLVYTVWQGKDRTQSQSVNSYALFSDVSNNTEKITIDEDDSGYRNYALIALAEGSIIYDGRKSTDEPRRMIYMDETKSSKADDQTQAQFESALKRKAKEELQKWQAIKNVQADTLQYGLLYLRDYDLGDKCDIVSNEMKKSYEARIIEVREVFKEGQHTVEVVFGDKIPTIYERVKNK